MMEKKTVYYGRMDKEILSLCDAINDIPGVKTTSSCCGHGGTPVSITLNCYSIMNLRPLTVGLHDKWEIKLEGTWAGPQVFIELVSRDKGEQAYIEAGKLASRIYKFILDKDLMLGLKTYIYEKYAQHFMQDPDLDYEWIDRGEYD